MKTETGFDMDHRRLLSLWMGAEPLTEEEKALRGQCVGAMGKVAGHHVFRRLCAIQRQAMRLAKTVGQRTAMAFLEQHQEPWFDLLADCSMDAPMPAMRVLLSPAGTREMQTLQTVVEEAWKPN